MIVTLKSGAKKSDVQAVVARIKKLGFTPQLSRGAERVVIGVIGEGNKAIAHKDLFESMPQVEVVTPISKPYKVVSRVFKKTDTVIDVHGVKVGGKGIVVMAGPCSVDTRDNVMATAKELKKAGVQIMRGGAFKPRTSPYAFQGLGEEALKYLAEARRTTGLPVITEVMDPRQVDLVERYADILQIGARNAQNYDLLREVGRTRKPAMLKRGGIHHGERKRKRHVVRAGNPHVRNGHAVHAGPQRGARVENPVPFAGSGGPVPRGGRARLHRADGESGHSGGGRRHHHRMPPEPGAGAVRRASSAVADPDGGRSQRVAKGRRSGGANPLIWVPARPSSPE